MSEVFTCCECHSTQLEDTECYRCGGRVFSSEPAEPAEGVKYDTGKPRRVLYIVFNRVRTARYWEGHTTMTSRRTLRYNRLKSVAGIHVEMFSEAECPVCGCFPCGRDEVDVGIGIIYGPYGCSCGWSEWAEYNQFLKPKTPHNYTSDSRGGWTPV